MSDKYTAIANGKVIKLEEVSDPVFAKGKMGEGYAIIPENGKICSPTKGTVTAVFPTGHAYGITTADGVEMLIHIGIDSVLLDGKGFVKKVNVGDEVESGTLLAEIDLTVFKDKDIDSTTMLIFTSGNKIKLLKENETVDYSTEEIFEFIEK